MFAAAFTTVWLPLFPRITATLAGMIAGPALYAIVGYSFFGLQMQIYEPAGGECRFAAALAFGLLGSLVWLAVATSMCLWVRDGEVVHQERHPLVHAVWSGAVMLGLAVLGITCEHFWH